MKRLLLAFFAVLFLISMGPIPVASARGWFWHKSHKNASPVAGKHHSHKLFKKSKAQHENYTHDSSGSLYSVPRTVGWWHRKGPGPVGAGAD